MKFNISELKQLVSKISLSVEKSNLNPKSGWIEIEADNESINFKVSNLDYYLEASLFSETYIEDEDVFHVTVLAETFIPLISKLEEDFVDISERMNSLILKTDKSEYAFPIIKEAGKVKCLDVIDFNPTTIPIKVDGKMLSSVATINSKGLLGAMVVHDYQQFIYVDNTGAITFTENMYVNDFEKPSTEEFKMLLTVTQAQLLDIFKNEEDIEIEFEQLPTYGNKGQTTTNKVKISNANISLIMITQDMSMVESFPSIRLRAIAANELDTHVIVDKKALDKALARLMVFDKKFDINVIDYSKIIFRENEMELISIKNKNFEKLPYISSQNVVEHETVIRFADLVKQLKLVTTKDLDISFGTRSAIVFNSGNIKQIIPEIKLKNN